MRRVATYFVTALVTFVVGVGMNSWVSGRRFRAVPKLPSTSASRKQIAGVRKLRPAWVFLNQDVKWKSPPEEIIKENGARYLYSENARLLVFFLNGRYASITCTLYKVDGKLEIVPSEGFAVFEGTWVQGRDGTITTKSRLSSEWGVSAAFLTEARQERGEQLRIRRATCWTFAAEIDLDGSVFTLSRQINGIAEVLPEYSDEIQP